MPLSGGDMFRGGGEWISEEYPPPGETEGYFDERGVWHPGRLLVSSHQPESRMPNEIDNANALAELEAQFGGGSGEGVRNVAGGGRIPTGAGGYGPSGAAPGREDAATLQAMLSAMQDKFTTPPPYRSYGLPNKAIAAAHGGYGSEELLNYQNQNWEAGNRGDLPSYMEYPKAPRISRDDAEVMKALEASVVVSKGIDSSIESEKALMEMVTDPKTKQSDKLFALGVLKGMNNMGSPYLGDIKALGQSGQTATTDLAGISRMIRDVSTKLRAARNPKDIERFENELEYWMRERAKIRGGIDNTGAGGGTGGQ